MLQIKKKNNGEAIYLTLVERGNINGLSKIGEEKAKRNMWF